MTTELPDWASVLVMSPDEAELVRAGIARVCAAATEPIVGCKDCGATWRYHVDDPEGCGWCALKDAALLEAQTRMDRERMADLIDRVDMGDQAAMTPLVTLWRAAGDRLGNAARWQIARVLSQGGDRGGAA